MSVLSNDADIAVRWSTAERVAAWKRIVPQAAIRVVLRKTGRGKSPCWRRPRWFVVWFVIAMALFCRDSFRQVVDVPDTPENVRSFGRPGSGRSPAAFPQARVLSLCEIGTHVLWKSLIKPHRRGEHPMARYILRVLEENMLLLWDRNCLSFALVQQVVERRAHVLARVKSNLICEPIRRLRDGSFLAKLYHSLGCITTIRRRPTVARPLVGRSIRELGRILQATRAWATAIPNCCYAPPHRVIESATKAAWWCGSSKTPLTIRDDRDRARRIAS